MKFSMEIGNLKNICNKKEKGIMIFIRIIKPLKCDTAVDYKSGFLKLYDLIILKTSKKKA